MNNEHRCPKARHSIYKESEDFHVNLESSSHTADANIGLYTYFLRQKRQLTQKQQKKKAEHVQITTIHGFR